jgi:hypothetical protein
LIRQPAPADPSWPRYSPRLFPPYRFVPGFSPHPLRDPDGHSYRNPAPRPDPFPPDQWRAAPTYLFGIDCYNFAFWWESHEVIEEIWHAVGHDGVQGQFLQALIQIAAAWLQRFRGRDRTAENLAKAGLERLAEIPDPYMGVATRKLENGTLDYLTGGTPSYPLIRLVGLDPVETGNNEAEG